jgi:signal transduction histidine kinase
MRLSIRARMILAMNLLVAAVGVAVGSAGIEVATGQIERRLIHQAAENAAELIGRRSWPLDSNALMTQLGELLGAEAAVGPADSREIHAGSLSPSRTAELARRLDGPSLPARVTLGGRSYCLGTAVVRRTEPSMRRQTRRLYLLVPEQRVTAAKRQVATRIALFTLAAVVVATGVGFWLSTSLARPVSRLADRMDRLAREEGGRGLEPARPASGRAKEHARPAGPPELARLTRSFEALLERLGSAQKQLERSARLAMLGRLAAAVAHELRNPLSGIKMNARVLAEELGRAGHADRSLELIIRETDRMDLYLQELLSLAAADGEGGSGAELAGAGWKPPAEPVSLAEQADAVANLLAGRCEHAGVTVERRHAASVPAVRARPDRIRQVLLNLMLNALEAMPHGGVLALSARPTEGGAARFEVADTGGGVRAPGGADIFEPFVTTKPQGTGLGLYVCRRVVESLGGRVGYESTSGGSTFWFELPAPP